MATRRDEAWMRLDEAANRWVANRGKADALELSAAAKAWAMADAPGMRAVSGDGPLVKFGRDKGKRLSEVADLTWYRRAVAENVADPSRERYRQQNEAHLAEVDAEIARRT